MWGRVCAWDACACALWGLVSSLTVLHPTHWGRVSGRTHSLPIQLVQWAILPQGPYVSSFQMLGFVAVFVGVAEGLLLLWHLCGWWGVKYLSSHLFDPHFSSWATAPSLWFIIFGPRIHGWGRTSEKTKQATTSVKCDNVCVCVSLCKILGRSNSELFFLCFVLFWGKAKWGNLFVFWIWY